MGSARGPRRSGWQRRQACPSCPWTRGELGQAAGEGWRRNRLALGSTHSFSPPPPRPGPRQAPPSVRHLKDTGGERAVPRGRAGPQGQLPRSRRAPVRHTGLRAWAKSSPRTDRSPGLPAAGVRFPPGAVPGDPAFRGRSGLAGTRGPAPGLPLRGVARRRRLGSIRLAGNRWLRERGWGRLETPLGSAARGSRGGVRSERSSQAVSLLLMHPSSTSSECNCVYRPMDIHLAAHLHFGAPGRCLDFDTSHFCLPCWAAPRMYPPRRAFRGGLPCTPPNPGAPEGRAEPWHRVGLKRLVSKEFMKS